MLLFVVWSGFESHTAGAAELRDAVLLQTNSQPMGTDHSYAHRGKNKAKNYLEIQLWECQLLRSNIALKNKTVLTVLTPERA